MNWLKNLFSYRFLSSSKIENLIQKTSDDAIQNLIESRRGFGDFDHLNGSFYENNDVRKEEFELFFSKYDKNISSETKDIILSSFDTPIEADLSFEELSLYQDAIWKKWATDPLIKGAVDNYVDYVIGKGVTVSTPVPEINLILDKFYENNNFFRKQKEIVKHSYIDGEYFALLFNNNKGEVFIRKCHPKTIENIETANQDIEAVFSFKRRFYDYGDDGNPTTAGKDRYYENIDYKKFQKMGLGYNTSKFISEFEKNVVLLMVKLNDDDKLRGFPPLKLILKHAKLYENFILDRMTLNHERAKVVWIKEYTTRSREDFLNKAYTAPAQGTMLIEKNGIKYRTEKPNLESSDAKEDGLGLLYYLASAIRFPVHILNMRTDQQVYASIRKADTPFQMMIEASQYYFVGEFERIFRYQIQLKVQSNELKKEYKYPAYSEDSVLTALKQINDGVLEGKPVKEIKLEVGKTLEDGKSEVTKKTEEIPITQDFPQMMLQDPKEMADVIKIHKEIGIASLATLSTKAGYKWKNELPKIMQEFKLDLDKKAEEMDNVAEHTPEPTISKVDANSVGKKSINDKLKKGKKSGTSKTKKV